MPTSRLGLVAGPNRAAARRHSGALATKSRRRLQVGRSTGSCEAAEVPTPAKLWLPCGPPLLPHPGSIQTKREPYQQPPSFSSLTLNPNPHRPVRLTTRTDHPSDSNFQISRANRRWRSWWRRRAPRQGPGRWAEALGPMRSGPRRRGGAGTAP
jgi:hypothetical protein